MIETESIPRRQMTLFFMIDKSGSMIGNKIGSVNDAIKNVLPIIGEISDEIKKHYTLVAAGMLQMSHARWLYGCTGRNLDIMARQPLWEANLDYKHGTGHGVGHVLNVHEGPNGFHWGRAYNTPFEEGMITTDEPGIYIEGKFGVRIEDMLYFGENGTENLTHMPKELIIIK